MLSLAGFSRPATLTTRFLLFLSLFNTVTTSPLPENSVKETGLVARDETYWRLITEDEYVAYLEKYFPQTDKYMLWTGRSETQVVDFKFHNPEYLFYDDFYRPDGPKHPYFEAFNQHVQKLDQWVASRAIARAATKQIHVFGGIDWATKEARSAYTINQHPVLKESLKSGKLESINHMAKFAESPTQVMAKEDAKGKYKWQPGYKKGTKNAAFFCQPATPEPDVPQRQGFFSKVGGKCCSGVLCWLEADDDYTR